MELIYVFLEQANNKIIYTKEKKDLQSSPFNNLLLPKPGGIGLTLSTMPYINKMIDFSIKYESNKRSFWAFLCGEMNEATIKVNLIDIPQKLLGGEYSEDKICLLYTSDAADDS